MTAFEAAVYRVVRQIPPGKVACYGQVALAVGRPGACRAVGNALHRNPFLGDVPCHRVVAADGRLSGAFAFGKEEGQRQLLLQERVVLVDGKVPKSFFVSSLLSVTDR